MNVFDAALARLTTEYEAGHRLVVSISGGKDSTCCTELAILAARAAGRLPVEVVIRDEEIMFPGTYEYVERLAERPEVSMTWLVAHQPIINAFDREQPYFWVCDPLLDPEEWVRQPPAVAYQDRADRHPGDRQPAAVPAARRAASFTPCSGCAPRSRGAG